MVKEGILKKTNKMTGSVGLYARNNSGSVGACSRKPHCNGVKITPIKGYTTTLLRQHLLSQGSKVVSCTF